MRTTPRSQVVDCGAAHVAVARFTCDRAGRLGLEALAVEVHAAEPGTDARWIGQAREALAAAGEHGNFRGSCRVALPGHLALTRLVAAPACDRAQRRAAWSRAAAQVMPFPLDELAWDARELPGNGADADLMLAAAKAAWMDELGAALIAARLEPKSAEPAVLSLARAYRYNYADATDAALVVDLGARSSAMLWAAPDGRCRVRTVALGGNAITRALAEKWGVDFTTAEARKRQWLDGGDGASVDATADAAVAEAGEQWVQRLRFEIARTLAGAARGEVLPMPTRILLTGGGSLWPDLAARLAAGLGLRVEAYDGLRRIEIAATAERASMEALRQHLAPLVGLAAVRLEPRPGALNLLTNRLQARQRLRESRPWILAAAATFAVVWAGAAWQGQADVAHAQRELATVTAEIAALRREVDAEAAAQTSLVRMQSENAQLRRWLDDRGGWATWLGDLQACLGAHGEVWLDRVNLKAVSAEAGSGPLRIEIGGWMLDLRHPLMPPGTEALARLQGLLTDLAALPAVARVVDEHHDRSRPGRLGFGCTLVLAPDHRL